MSEHKPRQNLSPLGTELEPHIRNPLLLDFPLTSLPSGQVTTDPRPTRPDQSLKGTPLFQGFMIVLLISLKTLNILLK